MPKTCGGHCCERFVLQESPEDLKIEYETWLRCGHPGVFYTSDMRGVAVVQEVRMDIHLVYPMVVYLGKYDWAPCDPPRKQDRMMHHYTCKHYDRDTKLCTIYENRPLMCRNYPNGHACRYPGCKLPGNTKKLREEDRSIVERSGSIPCHSSK
jgi:Fe-S-cluster containining protein